MIEDNGSRDDAVEKELEGVPKDMLDTEEQADSGVEQALAQLRSDLEAAKQETLYAKAETQNVRRRLESELQQATSYAAAGFARDMLAIKDHIDRALAVVNEELRQDKVASQFLAGIESTARELESVFNRHGVTRISAKGEPLDPNRHQAMVELPSDQEPGTVIEEMQPGYMMKDRLLRPALVGVAKKPD